MTYKKIIPFLLAPLLIASSAMSQTGDWEAVQALRSGTKIKSLSRTGPRLGIASWTELQTINWFVFPGDGLCPAAWYISGTISRRFI